MKRRIAVTIAALLVAITAQAQEAQLRVLHEKTDARLKALVSETKGITGFVAVDLTSGERFAANDQLVFPQGSSIKVAILMEVVKQARSGKFKMSDLQWIDRKTAGSGVLKEFGEHTSQLSIRDLAILMILVSDNTATNMLIDLVGMASVNSTLDSLGLRQTRLQRKMIDTAASARGDENLSTPAEAARLMEMLYRGQFMDRAACDEILDILRRPKSGRIPAGLPPGTPVAFKPGDISGVAADWAIVELKERPYVVVFMENYYVDGEASGVAREISKTLYEHFSRLGRATRYGTFVDPALLKKP